VPGVDKVPSSYSGLLPQLRNLPLSASQNMLLHLRRLW
jgi:hypothetical protein